MFLGCRYVRGNWTECDPDLRLKSRQDIVRAKYRDGICPAHRIITKQCDLKGIQKGMQPIEKYRMFKVLHIQVELNRHFENSIIFW